MWEDIKFIFMGLGVLSLYSSIIYVFWDRFLWFRILLFAIPVLAFLFWWWLFSDEGTLKERIKKIPSNIKDWWNYTPSYSGSRWTRQMYERDLAEKKEELEFLEEKLKSLKRKDLETRYDREVNLKITKELLKVDERITTVKSLIKSTTEILEGRSNLVKYPLAED